ncbi:MAG: hypothetical protein HFH94_15860, partial [Lachnospiraceae bacterium]|nr:hypothetical protein [Lachnospiraceae bacterium]
MKFPVEKYKAIGYYEYENKNLERFARQRTKEFTLTVAKVCQITRLRSGKYQESAANLTARKYTRKEWLGQNEIETNSHYHRRHGRQVH